MLDLSGVHGKQLRSFARFKHALQQLAEAVASGTFIATP
jgi:hypothetical protein